MDKKKLITSGVLATVVAVSGQFVQIGTTNGGSFFGLQRAEAFGIKIPKIKMPKINIGGHGDVSDALQGAADQAVDKAQNAAKEAAKQQLEKALHVDLESLGSHQADMMKNLAFAAHMEAIAMGKWDSVAGLDTARAVAAKDATTRYVRAGNFNDWGLLQNFKESYTSNIGLSESDKAAFAAIGEDQLKLQENRDRIIDAKKARKMAAVYNALAARDATFVISQSAKAIVKAKDLDGILAQAKNFSAVAKEAQSFINMEKKASKERAAATKKAEKASNTKDPTKQEYEAFGKASINEML
ncbi:hypothetical protein [uncultured Selenomonas sp.]|uniref:hypothetical protein n=1 Tax=uncultured Selenomonas sp. TaxID=159275 RepID=UPI0025FD8AD5|nr:hypothetical protein [uncultured Selenomonas sp.]